MEATNFITSIVDFQKDLLKYAFRLTGEREAAHDLLQETLLKALSSEAKFLPNSNLKQWVYTIMRNLFINSYRKQSRSYNFPEEVEQNRFFTNQLSQDSCLIDEIYDAKEMYRVVNALPHDFRQPFLMHVSGYKYKEIAKRLGLPIGTVKSRIHLTRQRLRSALKDYR